MSRSRTIRWALLIVAIAALGYLGWQRFQREDHQAQAAAQKRAPDRVAVPVRTTPVEKADFPVYLTGVCAENLNTGVVVMKSAQDGA
jgi:membrane fusion protein, multidrug efflux system